MVDKQSSNSYIVGMTNKTKIIPTQRSAKTYRLVLTHWDERKKNYHEVASIRIESDMKPERFASVFEKNAPSIVGVD